METVPHSLVPPLSSQDVTRAREVRQRVAPFRLRGRKNGEHARDTQRRTCLVPRNFDNIKVLVVDLAVKFKPQQKLVF